MHECMYTGRCRLAHGCIGWECLHVVLDVIYKRKLKNIVYGNALILNRYGNGSLELSDTRDVVPTASQYWNQQGITPQSLAKFWAILWARKQQHKILHVQWLVVHRALSVGTWLHGMGVPSGCTRCHLQMETQKHCFWECIDSQQI